MQLFFLHLMQKKAGFSTRLRILYFFCMSEAEISLSVMKCFKILLGNGADLV